MNKLVITALVAAFTAMPTAAFSQSVAKSWAYKPFTVTSTKQKREMSDAVISEKLMCKKTTDNLAEFMDLVQNFDLVRSSSMDGTMSMTVFQGKQEGATVQVAFMVDSRTGLLTYVWVDGKPSLQCNL